MSNIIIRHSNGSKAGLQETLSLEPGALLTIGRGRGNDISFDPEKEDRVSRSHCRIIRDKDNPDQYYLEDSGSVNGTYINNMPINGKTLLSIGDIITVGKNGPKIEFDLNPRPESALKKTKLADSFDDKKTTVHKAMPEVKEAIGKQTMQHIIRQSEKKNKMSLLIVALAILLLAGAGGYLLYKKKNVKEVREVVKIENQKTGLTPAEIAKANQDKVLYIEFAWKLTETATGEELYQVYMPVTSNGQTRYVGLYMVDEKAQKIVPYLTTKSNIPKGAIGDLIGSAGTGSGFVVDERGFIATNRHVAANWFTSFQFQSYAFPGLLVQKNAQGRFELTNKVVNVQDVGEWVPGNNPAHKGVNSYLDVTFANNAQRTPANTVRISTTHDVAMVKIELPEILPAVQLYDSYNEIQPGDAAVVVGYPGLAPQQYVLKRSQDRFNTNPNISTVPVPTISNGNVGRLVKGSEKSDKIDEYKSGWGDYYQLTINSTGAGNSGGPMFDEKGRAVGIFSANTYGNGTAITFAVPIKYAIELMGRQKVIE
ncbi:trypsin-like peptidase domain-containing protein [Niabella aquatica]